MKILIPCLCGPTGVGKTDIALLLAEKYDFSIISCDSRQIYKYLDIGTAKPSLEIRKKYEFFMMDIITPDKYYSAYDYAKEVEKVIEELIKKNKRYLLVGGSGLYFKALFSPFFEAPKVDLKLREELKKKPLSFLYEELKRVDEKSAQKIHPNDAQRIIRALEIYYLTNKPFSYFLSQKKESKYEPLYICLNLEREILYRKINERFDKMIRDGLIEEVENLLKMGYNESSPGLNTIGYKEVILYLKGKLNKEEMISLAKKNTRNYAKRQLTWFKREKINYWLLNHSPKETFLKILEIFKKYNLI
ncbi:MAG: tRNA (adenosine(37)-N6)-dimethylallyltransferase MiaA [candidate division WOR-3 bacterium]|nr:tRNA (adenosine(37)-N6)-dimethylallyltransferase MiaA [candidate division WOR-3 bacterium]MCX7836941.1 tRNA (adenosine(37)-N6)-dimethylallyltransferase MiaA [candidate division WOR-3 bacterium]MDW8114142.1 tRNA (adenosine(37)-N6)-dimethylallyltransferase MiaA [candidate division WOR-3 bacterium]